MNASVRWTHFTIPVSDVEASVRFFTQVCGLAVVRDRRREGGRTVWIGPRPASGRDPQFVVVLYDGPVGEPLNHFGFQCDRKDDVTAIAERAQAAGTLVEGPEDAGGSVGYYAIVREPSGHLVEFTFGQPLEGLRHGSAGERDAAEIPAFPERIATERLLLRPPRAQDAQALFENYTQDPLVCRYLIWQPHASQAETAKFVDTCMDAWRLRRLFPFVITRRGADEAIGMIEARPRATTVDIGYVLGRAHWGQGLMPQAISALAETALAVPRFFRVQATCDVENVASQRALEKSGFACEGRLERWLVHPNVSPEPRAAFMYARVR